MTEPTKEQIKEFWEWCGFKDTFEGDTGAYYWKAPNGDAGVDLPPIDLNNLFKYAVPMAIGDYKYTLAMTTDVEYGSRENTYTFGLSSDPLVIDAEVTDRDPALALFWTLWEVMKND